MKIILQAYADDGFQVLERQYDFESTDYGLEKSHKAIDSFIEDSENYQKERDEVEHGKDDTDDNS